MPVVRTKIPRKKSKKLKNPKGGRGRRHVKDEAASKLDFDIQENYANLGLHFLLKVVDMDETTLDNDYWTKMYRKVLEKILPNVFSRNEWEISQTSLELILALIMFVFGIILNKFKNKLNSLGPKNFMADSQKSPTSAVDKS